MWIWKQQAGELWQVPNGLAGETACPTKIADGYSGHGDGRDNPAMQSVHDVGPIPQGTYKIEEPRDTQAHGPYVLPLVPVAGEMFGRGGFLIHGDSIHGDASRGCVILPRQAREFIGQSADRVLRVVA